MSQTLKSRISVIILMALLLTSLAGTMCYATEASTPEDKTKTEQTVAKAKLNTKVVFKGNTYKFHNGKNVRKKYAEGEYGCGIVSIIVKNKPFGVYVSGEGWIAESQIQADLTQKYISLEFDKENLKNGELGSVLKINGEFLQAESANTGIIKYEDGKLIAGLKEGMTTVKIFTKDNKDGIEILASNYDGKVTLDIPGKSVSADGNITADMIGEKVNVSANGDAKVALKIEDGSIGVEAEGNGDINAKIEGKEILDANVEANGNVTASKDGITAEGTVTENLNFLQRIRAKLSQRASARIDKEKASVSVGGDAAINDKEVASGDAGLGYTYATDTGSASLDASILGNKVIQKQKDFPVLSTLKSLFSKIRK